MHRIRAPRSSLLSLLLIALILLPPRLASAQHFGRNKIQYENFDWRILNTPHFEIFFYDGEERLAARAALIVEDAYLRLSETFATGLSERVPFILYDSHNAFQQNNISGGLIGEGTGGFSEPLRNRMVLPYPGDNAAFVHVINHELVHVFMFEIAYRRGGKGGKRRELYPIPLWFAEGAAEWFSTGWDEQADMWMRDATIYDWVRPLHQINGGFQVYKQGQSAMRYMAATYGEGKVVEFFRAVGETGDVNRALENTIERSVKEFDREWQKSLRREYWPRFCDKREPETIARRLTDHSEAGHYFAQRPALSPDGESIAFFSDREGLVNLYLMSTSDGKVTQKLATGYRSNEFLSFHSFESGISFSRGGEAICFVAKSGNDETLYVLATESGEILRQIPLRMDIARSPAWSPVANSVVLSGTRDGQTDLYLVDLLRETVTGMTDDLDCEFTPAWSPAGDRIVFSAYPDPAARLRPGANPLASLAGIDWASRENLSAVSGRRELRILDPATGEQGFLVGTSGDDSDPLFIDDSEIVFVSDASGISNLCRYDLASHELRRFTDVLGGIFQPAVSAKSDNFAFVAFGEAGFDIYLMENYGEAIAAGDFPLEPEIPAAPGQEAAEERVGPPASTTGYPAPDTPDAALIQDTALLDRDEEAGTPAVHAGEVEDYSPRFSIDPFGSGATGGVSYSSSMGLGVANAISMSDLLGNHRLGFLLNFRRSIASSDLAASYYYLKRRINCGVGIFHYRYYRSGSMTTLGEVFDRDRLYSDRNYGAFFRASLPLSVFDRVELDLQAFRTERIFYELGESGYLEQTDSESTLLVQPSLSYVHDGALYGSNGPMLGSRWTVSLSPAIPIGGDGIDRFTAYADYRKYMPIWARNSVALRVIGAASMGSEPRNFVLGGPMTMRGYSGRDFDDRNFAGDLLHPNLVGSNMLLLNLEYRFPFVDYLLFGWPDRFGLGAIGGVLFLDVGGAFDENFRPFERDGGGHLRLADLNGDFGVGFRARLGWLPMKFDWAWRTDFAHSSRDAQYSFAIAPEF